MSKLPKNSNQIDSVQKDSKSVDDKNSSNSELINTLREKISKLSYEESLEKLEILLDQMKSERMPINELKQSFLEGSLYLEHCENLLDKVEQEVFHIELEK